MDVAIRPPTCSLPVIFLGDLEETCILCFSRRFCSHVNCECVMSRGLIPSFHQNVPSRMWFSPRPQSKPRSHSGNGRAGGCEPYASAFLTSSCILPPSVSQVPPRRICQINSIACRQEIWRCHRCGGKRRFPPRHRTAWRGKAEYGRQTECGSPHGSIYPDSKHRREWKVPRRGIHSRADMTFSFPRFAPYTKLG